ncbi:hypothetical protein EGK75_09210 [Neisseria weixii]|uniref:Uncharacterized protein n=1 Tax=Neisseria weixii TaxID=1853276 RepID=A0A3N4N028_9NEIS|nr:hypothetical protein [Neisseria weixii]RPD86289.1 hypothetical protein EGK75_09210 [Neisseria weixii]RPD89391.1 hypothetical protein EGK74_04005 [Neisseria weixii]
MSIKISRAFEKAGIPNMPMVRRHILDSLKKTGADLEKLSSTEISYIIKGLHIGYHDAKGSQQADYMADMDCVWIGGGVEKLIPIPALKSIETTVTYEKINNQNWKVTHYKMDFAERA